MLLRRWPCVKLRDINHPNFQAEASGNVRQRHEVGEDRLHLLSPELFGQVESAGVFRKGVGWQNGDL